MLQNLSSAAVVIGALRVNPLLRAESSEEDPSDITEKLVTGI